MASPPPGAPDKGTPSEPLNPLPESPTKFSSTVAAAEIPTSPVSPTRAPPTASGPTSNMTSSSTPLGAINAARRPGPPQATMSNRAALPQDLQARMKAFHLGRQGAPPARNQPSSPITTNSPSSPTGGRPTNMSVSIGPETGPGGIPAGFRPAARPAPQATSSSPAVPVTSATPSLAQKRGMVLPGGLSGTQQPPVTNAAGVKKKKPGLSLSQMNAGPGGGGGGGESKETASSKPDQGGSLLDKYSEFIDKSTGALRFKGKATLTSKGVEFSSGSSFNISLDEVDTLDELGKGNYGTVYKVRHSRPRVRVPGQGLAGNKASTPIQSSNASPTSVTSTDATSGMIMGMKEIRLELDDAKFAAIIMELDILHRCISPFIIDFYGAFFQEGAVYICMEFMDGGSVDKLYGDGIPESVLRKITLSTTMGLKSLKDEHNIIHRDVKPTNILCNTKGQVKICDFGVSGNLVASIAKTNIGCQSYMAPERISSGGVAQAGANPGGGTYSVQSDIWSLGLTIIECALGQYPYPPETYDNIFSQLSAIVDGDPPDLPLDTFSEASHDFVKGCLMKIPKLRPTYAMLLQHAWLAPLLKPPTITEEDEEEEAEAGEDATTSKMADEPSTADKEVAEWVQAAIERRRNGTMGKKAKPALHAAPLDAVPSPASEQVPRPA